MQQLRLQIEDDVARALERSDPVVAMESTVIAHGLPYPLNLETALECEEAVRKRGAIPATIGIARGKIVVGLGDDDLRTFARGIAPDGRLIHKVGLSNMAGVIARREWGATTVAATLGIASLAGIKVFSTGGIGGVHRGAIDSFDISADLTALARFPVVCVCAGAKAILDLAKTVEQLETLGVPVVGYGTDEFPAFYSRASGLRVDITAETPDEVSEIAICHWQSGGATGVLLCAPVPEEFEIPIEDVERAVSEAVERAERQRVRGKALTPFLLQQMKEITGGDTLNANRALLLNNCETAAQVAVSLQKMAQD